jgi:transposase InsO family protein
MDLPESAGAMMLLVLVDRFTQTAHFIPINKKDSPTVAQVYLDNVWKYHGSPKDVVSDRDGTFTGQFFTDLYDYLGIERSMSTAYHPQLDSYTERITQQIQSYLRSYCNYEQNVCVTMLDMAEYADNNSKHSAAKVSPIYANCGFEPRMNWPTEVQYRNSTSELYGHYMTSVHHKFAGQLEQSIKAMSKCYDKKQKLIEPFKKGELVMVNGKNI